MQSRQKWRSKDDEALRALVQGLEGQEVDWNRVSQQMQQQGFKKSARQVRERWTNHLDPRLERNSLDSAEKLQLLDYQAKFGNSWKAISSKFRGRSDNGIKNQFFSLIRKSLRKARKCLKSSGTASQINKIKPKMLSKFVELRLNVPEGLRAPNPDFPWSLAHPVSIREFVVFFASKSFSAFEARLDDRVVELIGHILEQLDRLNSEYCMKRKGRSSRKRSSKSGFSRLTSNAEAPEPARPTEPKNAELPTAAPNYTRIRSMDLVKGYGREGTDEYAKVPHALIQRVSVGLLSPDINEEHERETYHVPPFGVVTFEDDASPKSHGGHAVFGDKLDENDAGPRIQLKKIDSPDRVGDMRYGENGDML